jgi:Cu(I)/Ag(I) efflux system membrane fusion protein
VIGVDPFLDPVSRTMTVRVLCANEGLALRPGMSALVDLGVEPVAGVIVPDAAVVDTGVRQVAFVQDAQGRFQPRNVTVGARTGGRAQILSGHQAGERVAASGGFLLDPETRMPPDAGEAPDAWGNAR